MIIGLEVLWGAKILGFEKEFKILASHENSLSHGDDDFMEDGGLAEDGVAALKDILTGKTAKTRPKRDRSTRSKSKKSSKSSGGSRSKPAPKLSANKQADADLTVKIRWNIQPQNFLHGFAIGVWGSF